MLNKLKHLLNFKNYKSNILPFDKDLNSSINMYNSIYYRNLIRKNENKILIKEGINNELFETKVEEIPQELKGGIICFSTNINISAKENNILDRLSIWLKNKIKTYYNTVNVKTKLMSILDKNPNIGGYSIGNFIHGRYKSSSGELYDEKSLCIEVLYIDYDTLIEIAEQISKDFDQQSVLVKDFINDKMYFVFPE